MTARFIRVGFVGAGANTRRKHIPGLKTIEGVELVSVANRSRESSERVAQEFGIPRVYDSWQELVAAPDTDAIVIGTWPYLHCPVTLAALEAGKHVMCEARMAMDAGEARSMLAAAQQHPELTAQVVPSPFTLHVDATIRRLLDEGYVGRLLAVEIESKTAAFPDPDAPLHWRQDRELSGMNVMSLGIWYEALMRWIGQAQQVTANGRTFVSRRRDPETGAERDVTIPDHLVASADMACGVQASFLLSTATGGRSVNEARLFGSEGSLCFRGGTLSGMRRGENAFREIPVPPQEAGGWRVEEEFIGAIRGTEPIRRTTFEDGLKYMAFTEAVWRSMEQNRRISCES